VGGESGGREHLWKKENSGGHKSWVKGGCQKMFEEGKWPKKPRGGGQEKVRGAGSGSQGKGPITLKREKKLF